MKNIVLILGSLFLCYSCADLDELAPNNDIPTDQAITDLASATAALNGVYDQLQANDFDRWLALPQFFSDEAEATGTFPSRLEFGNLNVTTSNTTMAAVFTDLYENINRANNIITLVPGVVDENFSSDSRTDIVAQAKFIRAQNYLQLVTLWGEVPIILEPTSEVGEILNVAKSTVAEVYNQAIADFTEASTNLSADTGPTVASKQSANAYLARIALYQERWGDAMLFAQSVLGDGFDLTAVPYLDDQVYSLAYTAIDGNTLNFFYGPSDFGGRYSIGPSQALINAFEPGDLRFAQTIDTSSASVPYGLKYPSFSSGIAGTATDPIYFIRHAEMVFIMAEAAAEMGDFATASTWLNQVRTRAGLSELTLDASNYIDLILQERFVEFAFEGPFRLLDLRRKGRALEVIGPIGYESCDEVWPLPQREMDRNPNLRQNTCCNC